KIKIKNTKILSTPDGAKVFIDNQFFGVTPFHKYVPLGKHELKIVKADYQELTSTINITQDEVHLSSFTLSIIAKPKVIDVQTIKEKASGGDLESQFQLGVLYLKDKTKIHDGINWLRQSANQGYMKAQHQLANEYFGGENIVLDDEQALKYHLMAAHQNNLGSQFQLGRIFFHGWGQDKDLEKAIKWLLMAANGGYVEAFGYLGHIYGGKNHSEFNQEKAIYWSKLGSEFGDEAAYVELGSAYLFGEGVNQDTKNAVLWYMKALEAKDKVVWSNAASWLGTIYENGFGISSDFAKAISFYNEAIEIDGNITAAYNLANMYLQGHGVDVSYLKAVELMKIAHNKGRKDATEWLTRNGEL
ncbi:PEGA domain-containing protein, partial [Colwellia sp. MB02u-14]|uniref:PEGA domain-containing protein n=1 Tax=Colwellia sp. MB02u-14 TaxID=2759815 RepID=UPI0015F6F6EE